MSNARLEQWEKQKAALENRIQAAKAREKERETKANNKRKFLLGAMLQAWMEEEPELKSSVMERMKVFLTRAGDRRYFGLAPLPKDATKKPVESTVGEPLEESETSAA